MPQPLAHAQGVVAHPPAGLLGRQADELEHLVDTRAGQAHRRGTQGEHLPAGAPGVLGRRVEQDADLGARVGDVAVVRARRCGRRRGWAG